MKSGSLILAEWWTFSAVLNKLITDVIECDGAGISVAEISYNSGVLVHELIAFAMRGRVTGSGLLECEMFEEELGRFGPVAVAESLFPSQVCLHA